MKSIDFTGLWKDFWIELVLFLIIKKEPKLALLLSFIEVGIEWFWVIYWIILVKEKDYGSVVLFFYYENVKMLSWRMDGTDRLKMALLCGFRNVNIPGYNSTFGRSANIKVLQAFFDLLCLF